ncbi:DUF3717 domain-containing protein [Pigmentiphaga aceris]|uniref:DUF3717 domain-containing protein n=1 Tax=Pigmentiphaga aceris TaxID=1940612 RepID=A0A5C0ARH0_9BURK|nr:DUF3717 domain-containing protein [Pigmentiphaga aceris]QEI04535.1 DUF3717 domain-containing protein [Pigmentiphaga aceris]
MDTPDHAGHPASLSLTELERAINFWRKRHPSTGEEQRLCPEAGALAEPYAMAIVTHQGEVRFEGLSNAAQAALLAWYDAGSPS